MGEERGRTMLLVATATLAVMAPHLDTTALHFPDTTVRRTPVVMLPPINRNPMVPKQVAMARSLSRPG